MHEGGVPGTSRGECPTVAFGFCKQELTFTLREMGVTGNKTECLLKALFGLNGPSSFYAEHER